MTSIISLNCQGRTQLLKVASSYLKTKNFIGKATLSLKLCCLPSFPLKGSLEKPLCFFFHLFEEMVHYFSPGSDGPTVFEVTLVCFGERSSVLRKIHVIG